MYLCLSKYFTVGGEYIPRDPCLGHTWPVVYRIFAIPVTRFHPLFVSQATLISCFHFPPFYFLLFTLTANLSICSPSYFSLRVNSLRCSKCACMISLCLSHTGTHIHTHFCVAAVIASCDPLVANPRAACLIHRTSACTGPANQSVG